MFLKLRILFTILAAICLALVLPALSWFGWPGLAACGLVALLIFGLMLLCKQSQEAQERKNNPKEELPEETENEAPEENNEK